MEVVSLFNTWLVSGCEQKVFRLYFSWTRGRLSETLKTLLQRFCYWKTHQKWFWSYHLPCSFKIFINVFAFLYAEANSKEICEEISFLSFFRKVLMSAFLLRFKANYLECECQKWKKHVENIKMAKFEAPIIKERDFMTVRIFKRIRRFVWKKLLESKALPSSNILHTNPLNFPKFKLSYKLTL